MINKNNQKNRSRTTSSHSFSEEAEQIVIDVAQLVELGSPTREVEVSIPVGDINACSIHSGSDDVPPVSISSGLPLVSTTLDQIDNQVDEEMDATERDSVSIPGEDNSFSDGSIQPGQRPLDSQEASHVSETQESLGNPLGSSLTPIADKTLKAMEAVRLKKIHDNKTQVPKPKF